MWACMMAAVRRPSTGCWFLDWMAAVRRPSAPIFGFEMVVCDGRREAAVSIISPSSTMECRFCHDGRREASVEFYFPSRMAWGHAMAAVRRLSLLCVLYRCRSDYEF